MIIIIKKILTKTTAVTVSAIIAVGLYSRNISDDKEHSSSCASVPITFETEEIVLSDNTDTVTKDSMFIDSNLNVASHPTNVAKGSKTANASESLDNASDTDNKEVDNIIPLPISVNNEENNAYTQSIEQQTTINESPNDNGFQPDYQKSTDNDTDQDQRESENTDNVTESNYLVGEGEFHLIDVPFISQHTGYPTGCEAVSAAMVLNFYGYNISPSDFIGEYLEVSSSPIKIDGTYTACSPWNAFIGNPYSTDGYGCYSTVIENALYNIIDDGVNYIVCSENDTLDELCQNYVANDIPVIVWATAEMRPAYISESWITPDGKNVSWIAPEHCLVMTGFDDEYYYFNDPRCGKNMPYRKVSSEAAFESLYCQSIVIARW